MEQVDTSCTVGGIKTGKTTLTNCMAVSMELNIYVPYDLEMPLLCTCPTEMKIYVRPKDMYRDWFKMAE